MVYTATPTTCQMENVMKVIHILEYNFIGIVVVVILNTIILALYALHLLDREYNHGHLIVKHNEAIRRFGDLRYFIPSVVYRYVYEIPSKPRSERYIDTSNIDDSLSKLFMWAANVHTAFQSCTRFYILYVIINILAYLHILSLVLLFIDYNIRLVFCKEQKKRKEVY